MGKGGVVSGRLSKGKKTLIWMGAIMLIIGFFASGMAMDVYNVLSGNSEMISVPTIEVWGTILLIAGPWIIKFGRKL